MTPKEKINKGIELIRKTIPAIVVAARCYADNRKELRHNKGLHHYKTKQLQRPKRPG